MVKLRISHACWGAALLGLVIGGMAMADTATLGPVYWDTLNERWLDIAGNPFANTQRPSYDYANATVTIVYAASAHTLTGTLTASGLKPHFAYQIKLNGKPRYYWGDQGDDWANEQIGYAGRWWVSKIVHATGIKVGGWNSSDTEYERWKAVGFTDGVYDYVFEGYLLFAYFVTDANGNATLPFALDSSFHVLWKVSQRTPTASDSAPTLHTVVASSTSPWYAMTYPTAVVGIYAEWQQGRALPGQCVLPVGLYSLRLFLTEESFHEGQWATVMTHDAITFLVDAGDLPPVAKDDAASTTYGAPVALAVLANDSHPDGDTLSVAAVTQGAHGKVAINADQTVTNTPNLGFFGTDTFTYSASDGWGGKATAKATITVSPTIPPLVSGRIKDEATGTGVRGVMVKLQKLSRGQWVTMAATTTNAQGAYAFKLWLPGTLRAFPASGLWTFNPTSRTVFVDSLAAHPLADITARRR